MKKIILINLSGHSIIEIEKDFYNDVKKNDNTIDLLVSPFKCHEIKNKEKNIVLIKKTITIPIVDSLAMQMNHSFWILNYMRDWLNEDHSEYNYYIITQKDKTFSKFIKKDREKNYDIDIFLIKKYYIFKINNIDVIRIPTYHFYDGNQLHRIEKFIHLWFYFLHERKYKINLEIDKFCKYLKDEIITKNKNVSNFLLNIKEKNFVNSGNEGIIYRVNNKQLKKIVRKDKNFSNKTMYEKLNVKSLLANENGDKIDYHLKKIDNFYKMINLKATFMEGRFEFIYDNKILPCLSLDYPQIAKILKNQVKEKLFIDDTKVINFGKIVADNKFEGENIFFEIIYNDFGNSFITTENQDFIDGLIRDLFFTVKHSSRINYREVIRSKRNCKIKTLLKNNAKFKTFFNFVKKGNNTPLNMICHDEEVLEKIERGDSIEGSIYSCCQESTMDRIYKKNGDKEYIYDLNLGRVFECGKFLDRIKKLEEEKIIKKEKRIDEISSDLIEIKGATKWMIL